jgi:enoyl-CoA hydratase/carnithine racemase
MHASTSTLVITENPAPGIWRLVLNKPDSFNALSTQMLQALNDALSLTSAKADCRVIVLAAIGKAFSAGHDLREMRSHPDQAYYTDLFALCSKVMMQIQQLPQPVLAQVQGIATAAGCQLVSMCDLAVAADSAQFAVSGINYGLFCSTPGVGLSRSMHRKQAMEMLLTGDFIDASLAVERGLINHSVPMEQLEDTVLNLCLKISAKPEPAVRLGKALFYKQLEMGITAAYQLAGQTMACNMMDESAQEGFQAFLDKRKPSWSPEA